MTRSQKMPPGFSAREAPSSLARSYWFLPLTHSQVRRERDDHNLESSDEFWVIHFRDRPFDPHIENIRENIAKANRPAQK